MKEKIFTLAILIFLLSIEFSGCLQQQEIQATTNPFIWKIEGEHPSYLYGTIHHNDEHRFLLL